MKLLWILLIVAIVISCDSQDAQEKKPQKAPEVQKRIKASLKFDTVQWEDPTEGAFTIEVPKGFDVTGGVKRPNAFDTRLCARIKSADKSMQFFIGDPDVPYFALPNELLVMAGMSEGDWYSPGFGVQQLISRYLPGSRFLQDYYIPRLKNAKIFHHEDKQLPANEYIEALRGLGADLRFDYGEAYFSFKDEKRLGFCAAMTGQVTMAGTPGGTWWAEFLVGASAPEKTFETALDILTNITKSFKVDQTWFEQNTKHTMKRSQIVSDAYNSIANTISEVYENRQRVFEKWHEKWDEYIRGVDTFHDSRNDIIYEAPVGTKAIWKDDKGNIVATMDENPPGRDFERVDVKKR